MTSTAINNVAAIAAAVHNGSEHLAGPNHANRQSFPLKNSGNGRTSGIAFAGKGGGLSDSHETMIMDDANGLNPHQDRDLVQDDFAIADGLLPVHAEAGRIKQRNRRASEGAPLSKSEGKRVSGELRCDKCGKGYKHSSCLTKHLLVSSKSSFRVSRITRPLSCPMLSLLST